MSPFANSSSPHMGQPQILGNHAPLEHFLPLTNNTIQQTNETQIIKQPDRPLYYYRDTNSDKELMENEEEIQYGKQHPWQTVTKKTKTNNGHKTNPGQYCTNYDNEQVPSSCQYKHRNSERGK
jgi:hypothetical protein